VSRDESHDLEATEFFVRRRMHEAGARTLETVFESITRAPLSQPLVCVNNHLPARMKSIGFHGKDLRTILGEVPYRRRGYRCPKCGAIRYPADEALNVVDTRFSPGVRRMMARMGAKQCFAEGAEDLRFFAEVRVDAKDVERVAENTGRLVEEWAAEQRTLGLMKPPEEKPATLYVEFDGTGIPMRAKELAKSKGKGPDGKAHTREVKLGCVFTQTTLDEDGNPIRDPHTTTYVGAIENSTEFGYRIHAEAARRGLANADRVIILTDGAAYNKTIATEHFPNATHVLDIRHATEHLTDFVRDVSRLPLDGAFFQKTYDLLDHGKIPDLLNRLQAALPRSGPRRELGEKKINYFKENAYAMRYDEFREMGIFVGSGVIEAGCRTVIGKRLKCSGMFWSLAGANAIIALRCSFASGTFEQFWEDTA
jgi:hypothetical protein